MLDSVIERIERNDRISAVASTLKGSIEPLVGDGVVRDVLTGRWVGHPAHPAEVIAPLAGWFAGKLIDGKDETMGFNASTDVYENLVAAGVIDPTKVVRTALQDAASVAGLLITTEAAISEKPDDKPAMPAMPDMGGMGGMGGF